MTESSAPGPLERFRRSMAIDYEAWHDGRGYDLEALAAMSAEERAAIEPELVARSTQDWRDVEALAALGTPAAHRALRQALGSGGPEIELAVLRHAPELVDRSDRVSAIVKAIEHADLYGGLSQAIDQAAVFHPPPIRFAIQRALLERSGEVAVLLAGLMFFIHKKAAEPFDWDQRPFFLRFHTEDPQERKAVYHELCERLDIPPLPGT